MEEKIRERPFAAHIREDGVAQTILEHLRGTAAKAKDFGAVFGSGVFAEWIGLLHDIGKYSERFQRRIYEGGNPVDHSTAGAVEIDRAFPRLGYLLAYCLAGHHGGLPDGGSMADTKDESTLQGRLKRTLEPYERFQDELQAGLDLQPGRLPIKPLGKGGFSLSFYIRMLFSCLVDGDYLDTERFMAGKDLRAQSESIEALHGKLDRYIANWKAPSREINRKRNEILNCCMEVAWMGKGLFRMTVPTGGGKTISSLAFALEHAKRNHMERIIYVIPYNSIIEQNAAVFKEILGKENVLEHHSNYNYDEETEGGTGNRYKLASENWDMPVIVTTSVQFFESLFANKPSKCRKLHNLANAVIIFDEAQMMPIPYLLPCTRAIAELVYSYGSTAVLCSATQPKLDHFFPKEVSIQEICPKVEELYQFFKRTKITFSGELDDERLAHQLKENEQVLCIVNTRKHAQNLFRLLPKEGRYHLSTFMYPLHRKAVLSEIRQRLDAGLPCRVVSTSLIEAGVDVDFPIVYRAEAGLDSIIQAAGRCNREARRLSLGQVIVFRPSEEYRRHMPAMIRRATGITDSIFHQFLDVSSPGAISAFFSELYRINGDGIDVKRIVEKFERGLEEDYNFPFAQIASEFHLIDNTTKSIIIPKTDEAQELVQRLRSGERNRDLMRAVQQYSVNVYERNYQALYSAGQIQPLDTELEEGIAVLIDDKKYDENIGLDADTDTGIGIFI